MTATSDGKTYTYDANGSMTADTNRTITYNYDNKPSSVTKGGTTAIFFYDGAGSRVKKQTGSSTTIYVGKLYEETGGNITKYIFAGGARIASKTSADTYYYHQDHLGSSSVITNSSEVKVEEIRYYPFGETLSDTGSVSVSHKYTSQELDIETGLYYYNARYYDPVLGRFISADPIVPDPTNPQALNRYSYVVNNPLKYTDPSGHGFGDFFKRLLKGALNYFKREAKKIVRSWTEPFSNPKEAAIQAASFFLPPAVANLTQRFEGTGFYDVINSTANITSGLGKSYSNFHTQSNVKSGGGHREPPSINNFRNFISNANEFNSFVDFIMKQPINRDAESDPFIFEKVGDSWDQIPGSVRNWRPNNWWSRIMVNKGSHPKNKRLPGGYHLTVDLGEDVVRVHRDFFDPLKIWEAPNHYYYEYIIYDKRRYKRQNLATDWNK